MRILTLLALTFALATDVLGQQSAHDHASTYAGQEHREIKSLSAEDVAELRRGGGWGLAKAAELNGVPGPAHLLELKDKIALDEKQVRELRMLYDAMRAEAIAEGNRLIALEAELEKYFRDSTINDQILRRLLDKIADSQQKLRYIHLSTHLKTPMILSEAQIDLYRMLRGYQTDPCSRVPEGHNAELWRKHNNCM
jgi:hypothetical protein